MGCHTNLHRRCSCCGHAVAVTHHSLISSAPCCLLQDLAELLTQPWVDRPLFRLHSTPAVQELLQGDEGEAGSHTATRDLVRGPRVRLEG